MNLQCLLTNGGWLEVDDFSSAKNGDWIATVDNTRRDRVIVFCRGKDSYAYLDGRRSQTDYVFAAEPLSPAESLTYEQVLGSFIRFYEPIYGKL